jgi:LmbE family N-acetylglucosaminyl deacetylase
VPTLVTACPMAPTLDPAELGPRVLVVAPHPDDESIGCGGLIALLVKRGVEINIVFITDGDASHTSSSSHPPERLASIRRSEANAALAILGVHNSRIQFCHLRDRFVPTKDSDGFAEAVEAARGLLKSLRPATLVIPSIQDAHGDHQAACVIWREAAGRVAGLPSRILEYLVWPGSDEADHFASALILDIATVLPLKHRAIEAHRSQHGLIVTDEPGGFVLPASLLARAEAPYEAFFEARQ